MTFRHILVPTDGSARSRKAIDTAVKLAKRLDAKVTALYVVPEGVPTAFSGDKLYSSSVLSPQYRKAIEAATGKALAVAERAAGAAGVPFASRQTTARAPWAAIVQAARTSRCDLIVMATHGKRGVRVLGSQTVKAITHTRIPVLVCR